MNKQENKTNNNININDDNKTSLNRFLINIYEKGGESEFIYQVKRHLHLLEFPDTKTRNKIKRAIFKYKNGRNADYSFKTAKRNEIAQFIYQFLKDSFN